MAKNSKLRKNYNSIAMEFGTIKVLNKNFQISQKLSATLIRRSPLDPSRRTRKRVMKRIRPSNLEEGELRKQINLVKPERINWTSCGSHLPY